MWTGRRAKPLHDWSVTPQQAIEIQRGLACRIVVAAPPHPIRTVAGLDVAVGRFEKQCRAGAVPLDVASLTVLAQARVTVPVPFPSVPGLLSFREVPAGRTDPTRTCAGQWRWTVGGRQPLPRPSSLIPSP